MPLLKMVAEKSKNIIKIDGKSSSLSQFDESPEDILISDSFFTLAEVD